MANQVFDPGYQNPFLRSSTTTDNVDREKQSGYRNESCTLRYTGADLGLRSHRRPTQAKIAEPANAPADTGKT